LDRDGSALVEAAAHDIGTGTYTVMAQVAADALGLTLDRVTVRLGDTPPESHPAIGPATVPNATAAVMLAAQAARDRAVELALKGRDAPFAGAAPDDVIAADGRLSLVRKNLNIAYTELLSRNGPALSRRRRRLRSGRRGKRPHGNIHFSAYLLRYASILPLDSCA
jgi:xanthine dehydrogenase YagR molybdenum-binding subunit